MIKNNLEYTSKKIDEIVDFTTENIEKPCGNTLSLTTDKWLFASKEKIEIISQVKAAKTDEIIEIKFNENNYFKSLNKILSITDFEGENPVEFPKETEYKAFVKIPKSIAPIELRTRREGDIIQPFGSCGTMKLKKFLINKGIAEHKRDEILLIAIRNEILWAIGVGISEKLRSGEKPTHAIELR